MGRVGTWAVPLEPFPDRWRMAHVGTTLGSARFAETGTQRSGRNNGGTRKRIRAAPVRSRCNGTRLSCHHIPRTSCKGVVVYMVRHGCTVMLSPRSDRTLSSSNATAIVETSASVLTAAGGPLSISNINNGATYQPGSGVLAGCCLQCNA